MKFYCYELTRKNPIQAELEIETIETAKKIMHDLGIDNAEKANTRCYKRLTLR